MIRFQVYLPENVRQEIVLRAATEKKSRNAVILESLQIGLKAKVKNPQRPKNEL